MFLPVSLSIKMLLFNIALTEKLSEKQSIFVYTIMCYRKLSKSYLSTTVRLYEYLKPKSAMLLLPYPDSLAKERVHLQSYVWLNVTVNLPSLSLI